MTPGALTLSHLPRRLYRAQGFARWRQHPPEPAVLAETQRIMCAYIECGRVAQLDVDF